MSFLSPETKARDSSLSFLGPALAQRLMSFLGPVCGNEMDIWLGITIWLSYLGRTGLTRMPGIVCRKDSQGDK
nr:hypothetical protein Q903MT_gene66 [Picea sitchensis]